MKKNKIILAIFAITQLTNYSVYSSEQATTNVSIDQSSQIENLLQALDDIKAKTLTNWDMLIAKKDGNWVHPEMHWVAFCDEIINLFNTVGQDLPENVRLKLIEVVKLKRNCSDSFWTQLTTGHALISEALVTLTETLLQQLYTSTPDLLQLGVTPADIKFIKSELDNYKRGINNLKRTNKFCSLDSAFDDLKKIGNKLKPILLKNPIYIEKIKRKLDVEDDAQTKKGMSLGEKRALLLLLDARINQSKGC